MSVPVCCGHPMIGVEYPDLYDGVALWLCGTCSRQTHRFPADIYLGQKIRRAAEERGWHVEEPAS